MSFLGIFFGQRSSPKPDTAGKGAEKVRKADTASTAQREKMEGDIQRFRHFRVKLKKHAKKLRPKPV